MRIHVNVNANVLTEEHSDSYRSPGRPIQPQITLPQYRARLSITEAQTLQKHLAEAIYVAGMEAIIARAKVEITADVTAGVIPATVKSFSELHAFVDANGYGGFFEMKSRAERESGDSFDEEYWNSVQDKLNDWIQEGGLKEK